MLAFALNEIHLRRADAVVVQAPREVFECSSQKQFDELLALGSIRTPTDAEQALYGLANPRQTAAPAKAPAVSGETAAQRKKREKVEADAAAVAAAADAGGNADADAAAASGNAADADAEDLLKS